MILQKKKKVEFIDLATRRSTVLAIGDRKQGLDFLVSFFASVRPSRGRNKGDANANMQSMVAALLEHPVFLSNLQHAILSQLVDTDLSTSLTESGIPLANGFWPRSYLGDCDINCYPPGKMNAIFFM